MKSIAIFLVLLIATTQATKMQSGMTNFLGMQLNFGPKRSIMTLLTQVEAQLKAGGPLDAITKMLADFKQAITEEQVQHDNLHEKQTASCTDELDYRHQEIADGTAALSAATETLDGCNAQYIRAFGDDKITKRQTSDQRSYLAVLIDQRRREAFEYQTTSTVQQTIISTVEESLVLIEELYEGEAEFSQIVKHTNKLMKSAAQIKQVLYFTPLLQVLVQMSTQGLQLDENLLNRVKTVLNSLKDKLTDEFQATVDTENAAIEVFTQEQARVEGIIAELVQNTAELEIEISALNKCIVTQTGITSSAKAKVDRNAKILEDGGSLCETAEREYVSASKARKQELKLLSAIKERVEARFGEISEGVTERGKEDEFNYKHENDYDHKEFHASA